jgi:hypothetical protein
MGFEDGAQTFPYSIVVIGNQDRDHGKPPASIKPIL